MERLNLVPFGKAFVLLLLLVIVGVGLSRTTFVESQQDELTADQKAELKRYQDMGGKGEPMFFKQKFILANKLCRPVEDSWGVAFNVEALGKVERVALDLAEIYGMKVRRRSVMDRPEGQIASAFFTGPESAARKLAEDPRVRTVGQDQQWIVKNGQPVTDEAQITDADWVPIKMDKGKESLKISGLPEPEGLWDYAADEAWGAPPLADRENIPVNRQSGKSKHSENQRQQSQASYSVDPDTGKPLSRTRD